MGIMVLLPKQCMQNLLKILSKRMDNRYG